MLLKNQGIQGLRVLAIDFGSKRIGLALSDPLGNFAQPLPHLVFISIPKFISDLKKLLQEKSVRLVLMGFPKNMNGTSGVAAEECQQVAETIHHECGVEVKLVDERLSTQEAEKFLVGELDLSREKRKKVRDSLSACFMLETYLRKIHPVRNSQ